VDHDSCAATLLTLRIRRRPPVRATGGVIPAADDAGTPPVLPKLRHQLPRQHLGVRVRERGAEVVRALEAAGDLRLGVLQHVRRDLGADVGALDRAVEARRQRRVVGVVVGPDATQPHPLELRGPRSRFPDGRQDPLVEVGPEFPVQLRQLLDDRAPWAVSTSVMIRAGVVRTKPLQRPGGVEPGEEVRGRDGR
jgi:hypothetical protein